MSVPKRKLTEIEIVKRNSAIKTGVIVLLLIASGFISYNYFRPKLTFDVNNLAPMGIPWEPRPTDSAIINLKAYRKKLAFAELSWHYKAKSGGVLHDTASMRDYLVFFKNYTVAYKPKDGYRWEVGYYPMVCKEELSGTNKIRPRLSVYMIPTMVDTLNPNKILDYWDYKDSTYYPQASNPKKPYLNAFIYNQGTIFP
jgi:hypothetical protein